MRVNRNPNTNTNSKFESKPQFMLCLICINDFGFRLMYRPCSSMWLKSTAPKINRKQDKHSQSHREVRAAQVRRILLLVAQNFNVLLLAFINFYYVIEFVLGEFLWPGWLCSFYYQGGCLFSTVSK